jgi:hypothetical protein
MGDETPVFLTDERRDVLNFDYDGADSTERAHRTNIRARAHTALQELIEVAESPAINHAKEMQSTGEHVFPPEDVRRLLVALLTPNYQNLEPGDDDPDDFVTFVSEEKYTDEFARFSDQLQKELAQLAHITSLDDKRLALLLGAEDSGELWPDDYPPTDSD